MHQRTAAPHARTRAPSRTKNVRTNSQEWHVRTQQPPTPTSPGTPEPDQLSLRDAPDIVLEIELDGAQQVKRKHPDAILIFVLPPTREEQERRLRGRGDPGDKVLARLRKAELEEPIGRKEADYVVVNDDLDRTVDELLEIVEAERSGRGYRHLAR